ncbi:MAG: hypothetical protein R3C49_02950 [Planctomycetaceae bacterium]
MFYGLVYPISGMWKWGGGALSADAVGFADFAGSVVVHAVGGLAGLAGAMALGPRIGRYSKEGKSQPMLGHTMPLAALGSSSCGSAGTDLTPAAS